MKPKVRFDVVLGAIGFYFGLVCAAQAELPSSYWIIDLGPELNSPTKLANDSVVVGNHHRYMPKNGVERLFTEPSGLQRSINLYNIDNDGKVFGDEISQTNGPGTPCNVGAFPIPSSVQQLNSVHAVNSSQSYAGACTLQCNFQFTRLGPCASLNGTLLNFTFPGGYERGAAVDINYSGEVVGTLFHESNPLLSKAFLYDGSGLVDLGARFSDSSTEAQGISHNGVIVGLFHDEMLAVRGVVKHYFMYDSSNLSNAPRDLGPAGLIPQIAISKSGASIVSNQAITDNIPPLTYSNWPARYNPDSNSWESIRSLLASNPDYIFALRTVSSTNDDFEIVGQMTVRGDSNPHGYLAVPAQPGHAQRSVDSDSHGDYAVYRKGTWFIDGSLTSGSYQWGLRNDMPIADNLVWRPSNGTWYYRVGSPVQFGLSGDYPLIGDYDGDFQEDIAVYRPLQTIKIDRRHTITFEGQWYVRSALGAVTNYQWGLRNDLPVPEDFDGDGKVDLAVFRPSTGEWFVTRSSKNFSKAPADIIRVPWGLAGDHPMPGDYDGDGRADLMVWRPSNGTWYLCSSIRGYNCADAQNQQTFQFGLPTDTPVKQDFDGDHLLDLVVYRPANGLWFHRGIYNSPSNATVKQFGLPGDYPVGGGIKSAAKYLYNK